LQKHSFFGIKLATKKGSQKFLKLLFEQLSKDFYVFLIFFRFRGGSCIFYSLFGPLRTRLVEKITCTYFYDTFCHQNKHKLTFFSTAGLRQTSLYGIYKNSAEFNAIPTEIQQNGSKKNYGAIPYRRNSVNTLVVNV
jgi:hypothetical protein